MDLEESAHQARKVVPSTALLSSNESNSHTVQVCGKRKREVGLVIPGCYNADILSAEIKKIKECYPHFELEIEQDATRTPLLIKPRTQIN